MKPSPFALLALSLMLTAPLASCSSHKACSALSLDACGNTPGCLNLVGQPVYSPDDPSMTCLLEPQLVSCGLAHTCDVLAPSRAKDPAGGEWVLMSPCVPEGWTQTSASATVTTCTICQLLSLSECASATYCRVAQARQIDAQRTCLLPEQDVSCQPTTSASGTFHRRVVDPSGNEWITSANFIPPGWHDSTSRNTPLGDCPTSDGGGDGGDAGTPSDAESPRAATTAGRWGDRQAAGPSPGRL